MANIIDKNPRKPKVEGPKAQEAYIDELGSEWIDNHTLNTPEKPVCDDFGVPVPLSVQLRYAERERQTREKIEERNARAEAYMDGQRALEEEVQKAVELNNLFVVAAWERNTMGRIRDVTKERLALAGHPIMDCHLCGQPLVQDEMMCWQHLNKADAVACGKKEAELDYLAKEHLNDWLDGQDISHD